MEHITVGTQILYCQEKLRYHIVRNVHAVWIALRQEQQGMIQIPNALINLKHGWRHKMNNKKRSELRTLKGTIFTLMEEIKNFDDIFLIVKNTQGLTFTLEIYNFFLAVIRTEMEIIMVDDKCPFGHELGYDYDAFDECNCSKCSDRMYTLCQRLSLNNECLLTIMDAAEIGKANVKKV